MIRIVLSLLCLLLGFLSAASVQSEPEATLAPVLTGYLKTLAELDRNNSYQGTFRIALNDG